MARTYIVDVEDVVAIIRSHQEELDLSCDALEKVCKKTALLDEMVADINAYLCENGMAEINFGKHDGPMSEIVAIINRYLYY